MVNGFQPISALVVSFFFINLHVFIIWLNLSRVKRSILIGCLSGPNFAIRTPKMDRSRTDFTDCVLEKIFKRKQFGVK